MGKSSQNTIAESTQHTQGFLPEDIVVVLVFIIAAVFTHTYSFLFLSFYLSFISPFFYVKIGGRRNS